MDKRTMPGRMHRKTNKLIVTIKPPKVEKKKKSKC